MRSFRGARQLVHALRQIAVEAIGDGAQTTTLRGLSSISVLRGIQGIPVASNSAKWSQPLQRHILGSQTAWDTLHSRQFHAGQACLDSVDVQVPPMGESVSEGTISTILKKEGDTVKEDDVIAQIETDKVTLDVKYSGKEPGKITKLMIKESDVVQPGKLVATVETGTAGAEQEQAPKQKQEAPKQEATPKQAAPEPPKTAPQPPPKQAPPISSSTSAGGATPSKPSTPSPSTTSATPTPPSPGQKPERRVKMTRLRQRVAERLKGAQNTYAMLTTFNEVDMSSLMEMRKEYKDLFFEKHGVKLGFMSAFIKASAYALSEVPAVNAVIDGDEIVYRDYVDISIAVATPKGLVVPVLRAADKLSFAECEKNLAELGKKAREGTISIDDMAGGTFTISNGGVYGSLLSTPIINPPQSAILGMHAITNRAMVVGSKIEPRPIMNIALTYDHRLIDGREAVTFLKRVKEVVEDPRRMLIDC